MIASGMASGLPPVASARHADRTATPAAGHRLLLFDIDGTLLSAGRAARESVLAALEHVYGFRADPDAPRHGKYDFSGKTDPQIVRELVADAVGSERCEASLERALDRYLDELRQPADAGRRRAQAGDPGAPAAARRRAGRDAGAPDGQPRAGRAVEARASRVQRVLSRSARSAATRPTATSFRASPSSGRGATAAASSPASRS